MTSRTCCGKGRMSCGSCFVPGARSTDPLTEGFSRPALSPSPPVRRREELAPVRIWRLPSGRQVVDFGQNLNGGIRLRGLGQAGTRTVLSHGEWLDQTGDLTVGHHGLEYELDPGLHELSSTGTVGETP